jgi:protein-tyrosine-phosphatase
MTAATTDPRQHVTFVCTYNRARSVMAATMFAQEIRDRGLDNMVRVTSGGTSDSCAGQGADVRARRVLLDHGYADQTTHRATQVGAEHLAADLVVVMTGQQSLDLAGRGVDADRIRLLRSFDPSAVRLDVKNPCWGTDFDEVFALIEAALPGLLDWFGRPPRSPRLPVAVGWRFWIGRPGEDVLRSPYYGLGKVPEWPKRRMRATCRRHPDHVPPVSGCACGVYADHLSMVAWARADMFPQIVQKWGSFAERGFRAGDWVRFVGRCSLEGAEVRQIPVKRMDFVGTRLVRQITTEEICATSAKIRELYVFDPDVVKPGASELVEGIMGRYKVSVNCRASS